MHARFSLHHATHHLAALIGRACPGVERPGLVVALSGGPDSVALLLVACAWARLDGSVVAAAHLNHTLRPGASDADAQFCRALCARLGVALHEETIDPRPLARERGLGLEEAARHLRRRFLSKVLAELPHGGCIATGHHRDDQVETVLMRLLRGTGPEGLRGIRPVQGEFIHPLLVYERAAILAFLESVGQSWRVDATNLEGNNLRARIRREVLPLLRDVFGAGCTEGPVRLAEFLEADLALLDDLAAGSLEDVMDEDALSIDALLALHPALAGRVLRRWLTRETSQEGTPCALPAADLESAHINDILAWLQTGMSGGGLDLPGGRRVTREFNRLVAGTCPALPDTDDWRVVVQRRPDGAIAPHGVGEWTDGNAWHLVCPASALNGNVRVRRRQTGDRLQPLGRGGTKKVSDILRECRVPVARRAETLVVSDEAGILWVVGLARDERTRLLPEATGMVTISVIRRSSPKTQGYHCS